LNEVGTGAHDGEAFEVGIQYVVFRADPWKDRERQLARRRRTIHPALDSSQGCGRTPVATLGVRLQDRRVLANLLVYSTSSNAVHLTLCIETSFHGCLLVPDAAVHIDLLKRDHLITIITFSLNELIKAQSPRSSQASAGTSPTTLNPWS